MSLVKNSHQDLEERFSKYAISLPRGYYDGLKEALVTMKGDFGKVAVTSMKKEGMAGVANSMEELVYDQLSKRMGFEDVEVVDKSSDYKTASITIFNPQTDEASEVEVYVDHDEVWYVARDIMHEADVTDALKKIASMNKEAVCVKKIVRQRKYKHGYIIRDEYWAMNEDDPEEEWTLMERTAYTPCGEYIGDSKTAYYLCKTMGIIPRVASPDHTVCSIGYNPIKKRWFGWSHRGICGFGIGDKIFDPDFGSDKTPYRKHGHEDIKTMEDAMKAAIAFAEYVA